MMGHALRRTDVTDELLARRILALEERIERVETTGPFTNKMILDRLAELRRDTADRFDQMDQRLAELRRDTADRFDRMDRRFETFEGRFETFEGRLGTIEGRLGTIEGLLGQVLALIGGPPGRS